MSDVTPVDIHRSANAAIEKLEVVRRALDALYGYLDGVELEGTLHDFADEQYIEASQAAHQARLELENVEMLSRDEAAAFLAKRPQAAAE